jgi:DivIVA domain-containing protein
MVDVIWLWALVTVGVIGAIAVVASGRWGSMADVDEDRPDALVSAGYLTGEQIKDVRFTHSVRGYRQDEVDTLLDLVAAELDRRESMLRQANIGLEQTRPQAGSRGRAGTGDSAGPGRKPSVEDEENPSGYPWDDAGYQGDDADRSGDSRTAEPPPVT